MLNLYKFNRSYPQTREVTNNAQTGIMFPQVLPSRERNTDFFCD